MQTPFGMNFTVDGRDLEKFVKQGVSQELQTMLRRVVPELTHRAQEMVAEAIESSPEWRQLLDVGSGDNVTLREHFGLADPYPVLKRIVQAVQNGIVVEVAPPAGNSLGSITVRILPGDYAAVLNVEGAEYISQGRFRRARQSNRVFYPNESHPYTYVIPWLRWLLLGGSGIILIETEINTKATARESSRTGRAIMVHPTKRPPQGWRVPTEYAGTEDDNWLTRALRDARVGEKIQELIKRAFS